MISLDGKGLTVEEAARVVFEGEAVRPAPEALQAVKASAEFVERLVSEGRRVYGINTGFGKLSTVAVPDERLSELQVNLLRSHACGVGEPWPQEVGRAALLFRVNTLLQGRSGVRPAVIDLLVRLLNAGVGPLIPCQGSVGSSGDLAPLAHMALLLIGEGRARLGERTLSGQELLRELGLEPLTPAPKEGLALINGTQVSLAVAFTAYLRGSALLEQAPLIAALSLEAAGAATDALDARVHACQPHPGQAEVAERMRRWLEGSRLVNRSPDVQDPYTLRCVPQVLGACATALGYARSTLEVEMNSSTDNPLLFPETAEALSGGNFHGEALALACELMGMALAEAGSFSERRTALLLERPDLPPFLVAEGGLHSGLMIPQYTAASLVSENRVLAHPAVVDSVPTSGGKEDHNSLASVSAWKAHRIAENVERILAVELVTAAQALDFLEEDRMAPGTRRAHRAVRERVPHLEADRPLHLDLEAARALISERALTHV